MEIDLGGAPQKEDLIKDSDTEHFVADVIEASNEVPVIVDFWAPWCGPCKQLGPQLENAVQQAGGRVRLVKVNIDENQQLASQLRVQSIPAVFAFKDGRPVDGFMGAIPESQIKQFIDGLGTASGAGGQDSQGDDLQSRIQQVLDIAEQAIQEGDLASAEQAYQQILQADPGNFSAMAGIILCRAKAGQVDEARAMIQELSPAEQQKAELDAAKAAITLAEQASEAQGELAPLQEAVEKDDNDLQARFDYACALMAAGENEEAASHLLEIIRREKGWNEDAARRQLLTLFDALGPTDPLTVKTRRALSSMLFS